MLLSTRRILYFSFIFAFILITPILILYSLGYNLNSGFKLQKSGILIIETEPKGATVIFGDKKIDNFWSKIFTKNQNNLQTPAKLKNIQAGEYEVSLTLKGYWPWTKKLIIKAGETTFANKIFLFRNNLPTFIDTLPNEDISFSANKKYLVDISSSSAQLIKVDNDKNETSSVKIATSSNIGNNIIRWSGDQKKVIYGFSLFFIDDWTKYIDLSKLLGGDFSKYSWGDDSSILYTDNKKIFSFDIYNNSNQEILELENTTTMLAKNNLIFAVQKSETESNLLAWNKNDKQSKVLLKLPYSHYELLDNENKYVDLYDSINNILYIVDPSSDLRPLKETIHSCNKFQWVSNSKILYTSGFEIWLADLDTSENKLLTRLSDRITNMAWHPSENYIIFSTEKNIYILELDTREKNTITKIADFSFVKDMLLDKNGEKLYIIDSKNNENNLYKMFIQ